MASDILLGNGTIELVDASSVTISDDDGRTFVRIEGRLTVSGEAAAEALSTEALVVGTGAPGESRPLGRLTVNGANGHDILEVRGRGGTNSLAELNLGSAQYPGQLKIRASGQHFLITPTEVRGASASIGTIESGDLTVGQGAPGEPREAGVVRLLNDGGTETIEIDAGGVDIQKPSIKVRWKTAVLARTGTGTRFPHQPGNDGRIPSLPDNDDRFPNLPGSSDDGDDDDEGMQWEQVEIDLVEEVLTLREQVKNLTERLTALETSG